MQIFVKIGGHYFEISQFEKFVVTLVGADFLASSFERIDEEFSFTKNYPQNINHVTIAKSDYVCFQMNQTIISDKTQKIVNHNKVSYLEMTWQPSAKNCLTISPQFYAKIICDNSENCRISCRRKYRFNKPREYKVKKIFSILVTEPLKR